MNNRAVSFGALAAGLKQYRFHLPALLCTGVTGIFASLLGALVYAVLGGGFLPGMLATLTALTLCAAGLWTLERFRPRIAPAANPQVIGALLAAGVLLTSVAAGLFNLNGHISLSSRRPLVLLVDKSGSMENDRKDASCLDAVSSLLDQLPESQELLLTCFESKAVLYGGSASTLRNSTGNRQSMLSWLNDYAPTGGTDAAAALDAAIRQAPHGSTILMITDSDVDSNSTLTQRADALRSNGMSFSCLHIGSGAKSPDLEQLAVATGGSYTHTVGLDTLDKLLYKAATFGAGDLYAPTKGFSAPRLLKLMVLGLLWGLTVFVAFGCEKGGFLPVLASPLLAAAVYLPLCLLPVTLPSALYPALLLLSYGPVLCFFRTERRKAAPHP